jgi:hypothetical protein
MEKSLINGPEQTNVNREAIGLILMRYLNVKNICAKMVAKDICSK